MPQTGIGLRDAIVVLVPSFQFFAGETVGRGVRIVAAVAAVVSAGCGGVLVLGAGAGVLGAGVVGSGVSTGVLVDGSGSGVVLGWSVGVPVDGAWVGVSVVGVCVLGAGVADGVAEPD